MLLFAFVRIGMRRKKILGYYYRYRKRCVWISVSDLSSIVIHLVIYISSGCLISDRECYLCCHRACHHSTSISGQRTIKWCCHFMGTSSSCGLWSLSLLIMFCSILASVSDNVIFWETLILMWWIFSVFICILNCWKCMCLIQNVIIREVSIK